MTMALTHLPLRVDLSGDLDLTAGDELEAVVVPMLTEGARVTVGLRDVSFADSSGLGALVALAQAAAERGAELRLAELSPAVDRVLDITGIRETFTIA